MKSIPKRYISLLLFSSIILLLFFILAGSFIVKHQRNLLVESHIQRAEQQIDLITGFVQESFMKRDFAKVRNFLNDWAEKCTCVYTLEAVTGTGFKFFDYVRHGEPAENYHLIQRTATFPPDNILTLTAGYDMQTVEVIVRDLNRKLLIMFIIIVSTLILLLTITLTKIIFIPMELEIQKRTAELRQANDELKKISHQNQLILTSVGDGICGLDRNGHVTFLNPAAAQILGAPMDFLIGKHYVSISHHTQEDGNLYNEENCPVCDTIRTGKIYQSSDEFIMTHGGNLLPMEYISAPLIESGQEVIGAVTVFRDITKRKELETILIKAKEAAEQANRVKNQFLANISHELRTPLNAIIGYSEILYEDTRAEGHDEFAEYAHCVLGAGQQLLGLINDILDIVKIESGKIPINMEILHLRQLIEEAAHMVQPLMEKNNNSLQIKYEAAVHRINTDGVKLRQILLNLLNNAAKFTSNGKILINIKTTLRSEHAYLSICINDDGIGMDETQIAALFQPFQQADSSSTRKYGGMGLGLTLTKEFVKMLGGEITVTSQLGVGSSFCVYFPLDQ